MASLTIAFPPVTTGRVFAATAAKSTGGSKEKGFIDWFLGSLNKEESMREVDPVLKKVEEKGSTTSEGRKSTVTVPPKKNGGFGGLFAKK